MLLSWGIPTTFLPKRVKLDEVFWRCSVWQMGAEGAFKAKNRLAPGHTTIFGHLPANPDYIQQLNFVWPDCVRQNKITALGAKRQVGLPCIGSNSDRHWRVYIMNQARVP